MSWHFADCTTPIAETLQAAGTAGRIVLTGPYPEAATFRSWLQAVPDEWEVTVRKAQSKGRCEARYRHASGRELRVTSAAVWFGAQPLAPALAQQQLRRLASRLNREFRREGTLPLVSPAVCGLTLWREEAEEVFPPLPEEQQTLIRATSGQGREELLWGKWPGHERDPFVPALPGFHYWDMRLAYASVCENLPVGPAIHDNGGEVPLVGRVRVMAWPPLLEWDHIGLLPLKTAGALRPSFPTETFIGWCDAREARLAVANGWGVRVLERLVMQEGRPLNTWSRRLLRVLAEYDAAGEKGMARACRAILLQSIGDLHGRGRALEQVLRSRAGVTAVREVRQGRRAERLSHPEWTAAIWARVRYRLAKAMLEVPRADLVGCYVDCIYTAQRPPWPDRVKLGALRRKGSLLGPLPAPKTLGDLHTLAHQAEETSNV